MGRGVIWAKAKCTLGTARADPALNRESAGQCAQNLGSLYHLAPRTHGAEGHAVDDTI